MFVHLVLTCVDRLRGERTVSGIYHLLTGKRSSQTLQDAKGYELDPLFGVYPSLKRESLEKQINILVHNGFIQLNEQSFPSITSEGTRQLSSFPVHELQYFEGMVWHDVVPTFVKRVYLLLQAMANSNAGIHHYVPIVDDFGTQNWVRKVHQQFQDKLPKMGESLYEEIHHLLKKHPSLQAELFVHRLTGGGVIGMTIEQLTREFELYREDVEIMLQHTYYYLFLESKRDKARYPVLHLCTKGLDATHLITRSARKTYQYIEQGLSMQEIMNIRRLKKSTIQDHIVESALIIPDFSIASFLSEVDVREINKMGSQLDTKKLKQIHEALDGKYDYFELRLALAKGQHAIREGMTKDES
ncbi:helix-turn-helix domain-containing protein [Halobacillus sp. HZG1]|uniref:helix-turn-helix domain-containing protein n=1 Tax=Halobacillus sp. HZG1 TaxID=3111769 RepID=UPI002DB5CC81|nr:helix-turn-helix domain-containing protein [Halobacillus sp. HZG1]MEC3884701.1 helix-turn-helix domain-containing protein [Halobacillus sp. HZG1]